MHDSTNYWLFGVYPRFGILKTRELDVSKGPNRVGVSSLHLRMETDSVSETLCSLVCRIPDNGRSPETQ
jgi:hypothetical protein